MTPLEIAIALGAYENIEMNIINVNTHDMFVIKRTDFNESPVFIISKDVWGSYGLRHVFHKKDNLITLFTNLYGMSFVAKTVEQLTKWIDSETVAVSKKAETGINTLLNAFNSPQGLAYGTEWMHHSLSAITGYKERVFLAQIYMNRTPFEISEMFVYSPNGKKEKDKTFYLIDKHVSTSLQFKRVGKENKLRPIDSEVSDIVKATFPEIF